MATVPCPECGAPTDAGEPCDECYADSVDALDVPDEITVEVCGACGSYVHDGDWTSHDEPVPDTDVAVRAVKDAVGVHVDARDPSLVVGVGSQDRSVIEVRVELVAYVRGYAVEEETVVSVRLERTSCPTCSKRAGGYYESVVQVRAEGREPTDEETDRALEHAYGIAGRDYSDRDTFVTKTEEVRGGLDVYMSTNRSGMQVARRLVDEFGGGYTDSATLVGERDGEELYRVTYAVSLPEFTEGDIVGSDGDAVLVVSGDEGDGLRGIDLATGERRAVDTEDARLLGRASEAEETTVVTSGDDEVRLLHPETYETVTVRRPSFLDAPQGAEIPVVATKDGVFPVPNRNS